MTGTPPHAFQNHTRGSLPPGSQNVESIRSSATTNSSTRKHGEVEVPLTASRAREPLLHRAFPSLCTFKCRNSIVCKRDLDFPIRAESVTQPESPAPTSGFLRGLSFPMKSHPTLLTPRACLQATAHWPPVSIETLGLRRQGLRAGSQALGENRSKRCQRQGR